jgi:hypothetical protein
MTPASNSFKKLWPEASIVNLLDESLAIDMLADGKMTPRRVERFARLGQYCVDAGADAILFTCSAFGEAINNLKTLQRIPILTPNQALFEELLQIGGKAAMLTTFTPSVQALRGELSDMAASLGIKPDVDSYMVEGALDELLAQRGPEHDRLIAQRVNGLSQYPTIVLGQFSMAQAALHSEVKTSARILTTPDCAVRKLKGLLSV